MSSNSVNPLETSLTDVQAQSFVHLERRVAELECATREIQSELRHLRNSRPCQSADTDPRLLTVIAVTEEMFGTPEITVMCDPEDTDTTFVVFTVRAKGENPGLIDKRIEWHERINAIPPGCSGHFRLSIVPSNP